MRKIQNTAEPNSNSDFNGEAGNIVEINGWEAESNPYKSEDRTKEFDLKLIKLANKKANINNIFKSLNITFPNIIYSPSGWTHQTLCPFKDHNEKTASFWYNSLENRFNCFGCSRGGGPVQFLSIYHGKKQSKVAKELLQIYGDLDDVFEEINDELQEKIDNLVLESSDYFKKFMKNHLNNPKLLTFAENLIWSLDIYLENLNLAKYSVEIENLEARINIIKRKLDKFE